MQSMKQGTRNFMHKASDKMKVAGAKASRGDTKDLDIAIVKATTCNFHVVPKEKHVRTLKSAVHSSQQRRSVTYVITELHKRLQDSTDWLTALKTLITIHRLMRETDPSFLEELVKLASHLTNGKGRLLNMDNFIDRTNIEGRFDFSEWVRAYGKYLDQQVETYAAINWFVEQEQPGSQSRLRTLVARDLLYQLPFLQRLQRRLLDCVPKGQAARDPVVLYALGLVVKESFTLYKAVSEGIINLADTFFEMEYLDAVKGLELYKESVASNDALATYYATIEQIEEVKRAMQLPKLSAPPTDFIRSMEQYITEAPRPAEGETHKKGMPLRKGRLAASGKRPEGPAAAAAANGAARDPGMVLPVGIPAAGSPSAAAAESAGSPGAAAAPDSAKSAGGVMDLLGFGDLTLQTGPSGSEAATPAIGAGTAAKKPSPLDLLSGLDFNYPAEDPAASVGSNGSAAAAPGAAGGYANFGAPTPSAGSNPFAGPAPPVQQPYGGAGLAPAYGSASTYQTYSVGGMPAPGAGFGGTTANSYFPQQQQQQGLASPGAGLLGPGPHNDFGLPSPVGVTASGSSPGGLDSLRSSGANPLRGSGNGIAGTPVRSPGSNLDLIKQAGAHDPFASLTGLPRGNTPGSAKPSPSKASPSISPNTSSGNLWA